MYGLDEWVGADIGIDERWPKRTQIFQQNAKKKQIIFIDIYHKYTTEGSKIISREAGTIFTWNILLAYYYYYCCCSTQNVFNLYLYTT